MSKTGDKIKGLFYRNSLIVAFAVVSFFALNGISQASASVGISMSVGGCGMPSTSPAVTWCYGYEPPTAPTNLGITINVSFPTSCPQDCQTNGQIWMWDEPSVSMDCDNSGNYDTGSFTPSEIYGAWWDWDSGTGNCDIQNGGTYTVNAEVDWQGQIATTSVTFTIQQTSYGFGAFLTNSYNMPYPTAPQNVPIAMQDSINGNIDQGWPLSGNLETDCNDTGNFTPAQVGGGGFVDVCQSTGDGATCGYELLAGQTSCNVTGFGNRTMQIEAEDPSGQEHLQDLNVELSNPAGFKMSMYPDGASPGQSAYSVDMATSTDFPVNIDLSASGLTPDSAPSYQVLINCGTPPVYTVGQPLQYQMISDGGGTSDYTAQGTLTAGNFGTCLYTTPGVYNLTATFEQNFTGAFSQQWDPLGSDAITLVVGGVSAEGTSIVSSPFRLVWGVASPLNTCLINGPYDLNGNPAAGTTPNDYTGLKATGEKDNLSQPIGNYQYKLFCTDTAGDVTTTQNIGVNVIYAMPSL